MPLVTMITVQGEATASRVISVDPTIAAEFGRWMAANGWRVALAQVDFGSVSRSEEERNLARSLAKAFQRTASERDRTLR